MDRSLSRKPPPLSPAPSLRLKATAKTMRATAAVARLTGRGGSVLGGHVGLRAHPKLITELAAGRWIAAVSATNGKTTTTSLLRAALATAGPVVSNTSGSNLRTGIAAALASDLTTRSVALEVDEATLATTGVELAPAVIVLGNLSRDQLDRYGEVRILAQRWRTLLGDLPEVEVVANADDPLVVWAVEPAQRLTWVAPGMTWTADAAVCPSCGDAIVHDASGWRCTGCALRRPAPHVISDGSTVRFTDTEPPLEVPVSLALPGAFNVGNAALALAAARFAGVDPATGAEAMGTVTQVAGRYRTVTRGAHSARLLMAKNPAGWQESLGLIAGGATPVVVGINARVADGKDPSWLWDVAFEQLEGRPVVAAGERVEDLSVRLHYAGVDHRVHHGPTLDALDDLPEGPVEVVCNYTAFADILAALP